MTTTLRRSGIRASPAGCALETTQAVSLEVSPRTHNSTWRLISMNLSGGRSKRSGVRTALRYMKPNGIRRHPERRGRVCCVPPHHARRSTGLHRGRPDSPVPGVGQRERKIGHFNKTKSHLHMPKSVSDMFGDGSFSGGNTRYLVETDCQGDNSLVQRLELRGVVQQLARHRRAAAAKEHRGTWHPCDPAVLVDLGEERSRALVVLRLLAAHRRHTFVPCCHDHKDERTNTAGTTPPRAPSAGWPQRTRRPPTGTRHSRTRRTPSANARHRAWHCRAARW